MTTTQQSTLDQLFQDYIEKKALYDAEVLDNYKAKNYSNSGIDPIASDASLAAKKTNMDNALEAYNLYKEDIQTQEQAAFAAANPNIALEKHKADAEAAAAAAAKTAEIKAKAELEAQNASFAAKNKQVILYAGVVLVVIVVGVFIYLKVKKAA